MGGNPTVFNVFMCFLLKYVGRCAAEARTEAEQGKTESTTPGAQYNHARRDPSSQRKKFSEGVTRGVGVYHALRENWRNMESLTK